MEQHVKLVILCLEYWNKNYGIDPGGCGTIRRFIKHPLMQLTHEIYCHDTTKTRPFTSSCYNQCVTKGKMTFKAKCQRIDKGVGFRSGYIF